MTANDKLRKNPIAALAAQGQSIWLDYTTRDLVRSGKLKAMIDEGVRGMTSNPTIFQKALASSNAYDDQIKQLVGQGKNAAEIFDVIAIQDIQEACDVFRSIYDKTDATDGFVSIEVSPQLAYDTQGSVREARRLWKAVNRPNLMIKIPGTASGAPAIKQCLSEGININITLLFSLQNHERVMWAYIEALEDRLARQQPVNRLSSVASYFVSRVDTLVDKQLDQRIKAASDPKQIEQLKKLLGKAGIANAKLAYARFRTIFESQRFVNLKVQGARVQRPLWASTSTKNPAYRDVMYVEELIGPDTVNTVPQETLDAFKDHGEVRCTVDEHLEEAEAVMVALKELGIDYDAVTAQLEREGVEKFVQSYDELLAGVEKKRQSMQHTAH